MTQKKHPFCPKCKSKSTKNTGISKIGVKGYRKILMKYICKECNYEFWT